MLDPQKTRNYVRIREKSRPKIITKKSFDIRPFIDPGVEMLPLVLLLRSTPPEMGGGVGGGAPPSVEDEFEFELAASTLEAAHISSMVVELEVAEFVFSGLVSRFTRSATVVVPWALLPGPPPAAPPPLICWGSR